MEKPESDFDSLDNQTEIQKLSISVWIGIKIN